MKFWIWWLAFVVAKWFGVALTGWSWLWVFLPHVPVVWLLMVKLGAI